MKNLLTLFAFIILVGSANAQMYWNHAAKFEGGTNSYVAYVNTPAIGVPGHFTIEYWVYPMSTGGTTRYHVFKQQGPAGASYYTGINSSNKLVLGTSPGINRIASKSTIPLNKWTHIAAVFRNRFEIFINGIADTIGAPAFDHADLTTDSLFIGKHPSGAGFHGMMDNIRIWEEARDPIEISEMMRTTLISTVNTPSTENLVLNVPFQKFNSTGTVFNVTDMSFHTGGVNRGITGVNLSNSPSQYLTPNEALDLTNDDSYGTIPNNPAVDMTGAMTIESWVYMTSFNSGSGQFLVHKAPGLNPNSGYRLYVSGNQKMSFTLNNFNHEGAYTLPLAKWTHVAFVLSGTGIAKIVVNGITTDSLNIGMLPNSNTDSCFIGGRQSVGQFMGYMDELRLSKFEKSNIDIRNFMFRSIDAVNQPSGDNFSLNFDGSVYASTDALMLILLRENAQFSNPYNSSNTPVSPLLRADNVNFSEGFFTKVSDRTIPLSGSMIDDSILVTNGSSITDINLFISLNHSRTQDLEIMLVSPAGDSIEIMDSYTGIASKYANITTIFDDQADSSLINNRFVDLGPQIKPLNGLSGFNGESAAGVWRLKIRDNTLNFGGKLNAWGVQINNSTVGIQNISTELPESFTLEQNYPNPFNPVTNIKFSIPQSGIVKLKVYDILGKEMAVLVNKQLTAGSYLADFNGSNFASGVYFYKLEAEGFSEIKKMMLVK